ncbi:hypothetical protein AB0K74_10705 [Streptomyces sp. NPDC056159]|uniref:hypothetical protein n=1 Tax=Streptomyces sp. NPDC056159 TaxID=3155537 RepID=UPI00343F736F
MLNAFDASKNTPTKTFTDLDGKAIDVRPIFDPGMGRNVVELTVNGETVRLSNGTVPSFVKIVNMAALLGEIENVATGNHSTLGE